MFWNLHGFRDTSDTHTFSLTQLDNDEAEEHLSTSFWSPPLLHSSHFWPKTLIEPKLIVKDFRKFQTRILFVDLLIELQYEFQLYQVEL